MTDIALKFLKIKNGQLRFHRREERGKKLDCYAT